MFRWGALFLVLSGVNAYNILIATPHIVAGLSHKKSILPIAKSLAKSGHNVVFWSPAINYGDLMSSLPQNIEDRISIVNASYSSVLSSLVSSTSEESLGAQLWEMKGVTLYGMLMPQYFNCEICELLLRRNGTEFDSIVEYKKWDLLIVDTLYTPCAYLLVKELQVPYIAWSTTLLFLTTVKAIGVSRKGGVYPVIMDKGEVDTKNFGDRLRSTWSDLTFGPIVQTMEWLTRRSLIGEYDSFSFDQFEKQATLSTGQLSNKLDWPTALLPNVEIFGSQCGPTGHPLPPDILEFVEDPKSLGTIFIAFGHGIKWSVAPSKSIEAFTSALKRLGDYRVIWQSDLEPNLTSTSSHILAREWLPQVDILHHPKTKVFISHTGAKSLLESICAGVPLVAMPQYAEQYRNTAIVNYRKIGRFLDKFQLTSDTVYDTISDVLTNQNYVRNVGKMREFFQDTIIGPDDFAVFHVERVIRRAKALKLLKNRGANMSMFVYFSLDILSSLLFSMGLIFFLTFKIAKFFLKARKHKVE